MDLNDWFLFNQIVEDVQVAEEEVANQEYRREFLQRLRRNPFELTEKMFVKYFRVSKELAREIIVIVRLFIQDPTRTSVLSVECKVLVALKFFGYGSYQEITGTNIYTSVSQSSVSRCIRDVCNALLQPEIFDRWVKFPRNLRELAQLRQSFYEKYNFPGIIGIIDCTHVAIVSPRGNPAQPEHIYVNRKNYHSINVQLICDHNLRILNVNARFPGSTHGAHIWRQSNVSGLLERIYREDNDNSFFLLGDSGYPLRPWLLTPLQNPPPNSPEERFNNRLTSVRSGVERCNGLLKNRFRCLLKHRVLHYSPEVAGKIINACVILHNMCLQYNVPEPENNEEEINWDLGIIQLPIE